MILVLAARVALATLLVVSGTAKLLDRSGTARAAVDLGAPRALGAPIAVALPLVELALAAGLLSRDLAAAAALAAAGVLLVFTLAVVRTLAAGRAPDCNCFGQIARGPIGRATVARNVALIAVALVAAVPVAVDPLAALASLAAAEPVGALAAVAVALLAVVQLVALRELIAQNGRLIRRVEALERGAPAPQQKGLAVGSRAPGFSLSGIRGETATLDSLRAAGRPTLLVFGDPGCGPCNAMLPDVARWQREHADRLTVALVTRGDADHNRAKASEHGIANVLLQRDREVAGAYGAQATPSAVLVQPDGAIGSALAEGSTAIATLVASAVGGTVPAPQHGHVHAEPTAKLGDPMPDVALTALDGGTVPSATLRDAVLVFWNVDCGFCSEMLAALRDAEDGRDPRAAPIVVISAGGAEANRALALRSTILLDQHFRLGYAVGAGGTPSAIRVDAGRIASAVAVGAPAVLALIEGGTRQPA